MGEQLSKHADQIRKSIREIEHQIIELDFLVLKTPTGQVREELTEACILLRAGVAALLNVC